MKTLRGNDTDLVVKRTTQRTRIHFLVTRNQKVTMTQKTR